MAGGSETSFGGTRAKLIEEVSRALGGASDYASALRTAARCAVPSLADLVMIALQQDGAGELLEVAHVDPNNESRVAELLQPALPAVRRLAEHDSRRGRLFRWIPHLNSASSRYLKSEPELRELIAQLEIRSLMIVPLRSGARILGGMGFAQTSSDRPFHAADLAVAQVIARRVAMAIEAAELRDRALDDERHRVLLEDALQKWIRVFDLAGWGAAIVNGSDWRIDAVNPAFARQHGHDGPQSLTGRLFSDLLPQELSYEPKKWQSQGDDHPEAYESVHLKADGTTFPVLTNVTVLEIGPEATSYVVTIQELTELKRAEERLHRAQRMEAVGRLAGGVAHEVNNMMTIIIGFGDLLSAAHNLPPERRRDVEEIRKAAMRAAQITQQLLAFSRQQVLQPSDLELNDVVTGIASVLKLLLPANVKVEPVLAETPLVVHADRAQLDQVLINLAFNARDAMPEGGTLRITTSSRHFEAEDGRRLIGIAIPARRYACLSVKDTGHGMDSDTLAHVFEPFFTTKPVGTGTGLGLATVYGIVKQSGGFVWVESVGGGGTTFSVCLPELDRLLPQPVADESLSIGGMPRETVTILLLEDEDGVRELARRVLEQEGCRVIDVRTGADAVTALESFGSEIDIVLSDVIVPDMGTVELEHRVRERRPEVPFVYMSGYSREDVMERGLVEAGRPFIQKPFTPLELARVISKHSRSARARGGPVTS